jgi:hypothetical protein
MKKKILTLQRRSKVPSCTNQKPFPLSASLRAWEGGTWSWSAKILILMRTNLLSRHNHAIHTTCRKFVLSKPLSSIWLTGSSFYWSRFLILHSDTNKTAISTSSWFEELKILINGHRFDNVRNKNPYILRKDLASNLGTTLFAHFKTLGRQDSTTFFAQSSETSYIKGTAKNKGIKTHNQALTPVCNKLPKKGSSRPTYWNHHSFFKEVLPQAATTDVPTRCPFFFSLHSISRNSLAPSSTSLHRSEKLLSLDSHQSQEYPIARLR